MDEQLAQTAETSPSRAPKSKAPRGAGAKYLRGRIWWIRYSYRGEEIRESTRSSRESDADKLLKARAGQMGSGRFIGPKEERVTVDDLLTALERDHEFNRRRALDTLKGRTKTLRADLGHLRAVDVKAKTVTEYTERRLAGKTTRGTRPSVATINRELATLRRAFRLGVEQERITAVPHVRLLAGERIREGFVEPGTFEQIAKALPEPLDAVARFGFLTGWRKEEILSLEWGDVDRAHGIIRLRRENSKNEEPRALVLTGALRELIEHRWAVRALAPWVFHQRGQRIHSFAKTWAAACKAAGVPKLLFHDLRRSAVRNFEQAGVSQAVAMKLSGHKTDSIYRRYRIVAEADLERAMAAVQAANEQAPRATVTPIKATP